MIRAIFERLVVIPIVTIAICNLFAAVCLSSKLNPDVGPLGGLGLVDWLLMGLAASLALIMATTVVIDNLLKARPIARRAAPLMYRLAMRCPNRSHRRLWLENKIMKAGREAFNMKRVRSSKRVIEALAVRPVETVACSRRAAPQPAPDYSAPLTVYEGKTARKVERPKAGEVQNLRPQSGRIGRPRSAFRKAA